MADDNVRRLNAAPAEQGTAPAAGRAAPLAFGVGLGAVILALVATVIAIQNDLAAGDPFWAWLSHIVAPLLYILSGLALMRWVSLARRPGRGLYERIFASGEQPRLIADSQNRVLAVNESFDLAFGRVSGDGFAAVEARLAAYPDSTRAFHRLKALARVGVGSAADIQLHGPEGGAAWFHVSVSPVDGFPGVTQWRWVEVTARREMENTIRVEQARLADFIENAPVGFYSVDGEGQFRFANHTFADWLGTTPERLTAGRRLEEFLVGGLRGAPPQGDFAGGGEVALRGLQGRVFQAAISQTVIGAGRDLRTRSVVRDLTPEREWQMALAQSEHRFERFYQAAPVGILLLDMAGRITECNAAFAKTAGRATAELLGVPLVDLVAEPDRMVVRAALAGAAGGMESGRSIEARIDGAREAVASFIVSRLDDANGAPSALLLHALDTTGQKTLEMQVAQSQKMQAVGQLAGGIAHDFNNLLTAMIGFCDLLLVRHRPGDQSFADIMQIKQNANRAANLVRQLLAFSRQQTLQPRVLSITDTLAELSNLLRRLIGENIEFTLAHGRDLGLVKVDQGQLEQVIINLVVNARDAMPGGGKLSIRTRNLTLEIPTTWGSEAAPMGDYVLIEVADTGTGIAPPVLERIFEPFFSTKEVGAGTGLGLATVYGILNQTGGFISVDSTVGEGTTFRILLPRHAASGDADRGASRAEDRRPADLTGVGTVLLVEDEDAVRLFGARALRNKGYKVLEARSGENALDLLKTLDEPIDLLITDVVMPEMDGPTLIQHVRDDKPDMRVICISGYAEDSFRRRLEGQRDVHFLPKPFSLDQLAGKVKDVLGGRPA